MAADPIVIEIRADIQNLQAEIKTLTGEFKTFKTNIEQVNSATQGFDRTVKAISFQTMTQGLLNVSTATAQVVTSLSNLDRVQYQVRASATAVERAEDQVARKRLQLAKATEKYGSDSEKAIMATNELETAMSQLENKQDRLKLAQDQVNDTYILFASNVANTVFGSLQTMSRLLTESNRVWVYNNLLTWNGVKAQIAHSNALKLTNTEFRVQQGLLALNSKGMTGYTLSTRLADGATKALRFSIEGLKVALGPVGIALIGISVAMEAYNGNWWGFKDALDGVAKSLGMFKDQSDNTVDGLNDLGDATSKTANVFELDMDRTLKEATKNLYSYELALKNATQAQKNFGTIIRTVPPGSMSPVNGTRGPAQQNFTQGLSAILNFNPTPSAYAEEYNPNQSLVTDQIVLESIRSGEKTVVNLPQTEQEALLNIQRKLRKETFYLEDFITILNKIYPVAGIKTNDDWNNLTPEMKKTYAQLVIDYMIKTEPQISLQRIIQKKADILASQQTETGKYYKSIEKMSDYEFYRRADLRKQIPGFSYLIYQAGISGMPSKYTQRMEVSELSKMIGSGETLADIRFRARELRVEPMLINGIATSRFLQTQIERATAYSSGERINAMQLSGITNKANYDQLLRYITFLSQSPKRGDQNFIKLVGGIQKVGDNIIIKNNTLRTLEKVATSERRTQVFLQTGVDIGPVADSLPMDLALQTAMFESGLKELGIKSTEYAHSLYGMSGNKQIMYVPGLLPGMTGYNKSLAQSLTAQNISGLLPTYNIGKVPTHRLADQVAIRDSSGSLIKSTYTDLLGRQRMDLSELVRVNLPQQQRAAASIKLAQDYYKNVVYGGKVATPAHILLYDVTQDAILNSRVDKSFMNPDPIYSILASRFGLQPPKTIGLEEVIQMTLGSGNRGIQSTLTSLSSQYNSEVSSFMDQIYSLLPSNLAQAIVGGAQGIGSAAMGRAYMDMMSRGIRSSHSGSSVYLNRSSYANISADYIQNLVDIYKYNNYGIFDAIIASRVLGSYFASPELAQETKIFETQIQPILNISYGEFSDSLVDPKRGYDEIDDRLRYTSRLEQISTGATLI